MEAESIEHASMAVRAYVFFLCVNNYLGPTWACLAILWFSSSSLALVEACGVLCSPAPPCAALTPLLSLCLLSSVLQFRSPHLLAQGSQLSTRVLISIRASVTAGVILPYLCMTSWSPELLKSMACGRQAEVRNSIYVAMGKLCLCWGKSFRGCGCFWVTNTQK